MEERRANDAVYWFLSELTARVVAESGIPSDRFHLGKIILRSLKDYPDAVMQIDGATGEMDTNASILEKSVRCATSFRNFGLQVGDVIVLMAPNHLSLSVPFYAALYLGLIVSPVDRTLGVSELKRTFDVYRPKMIFCQSVKLQDIQTALVEIGHNVSIVTFDKSGVSTLTEFIEKYADDTSVQEFKSTDFDAETTSACLIPTSGTTGFPKAVEVLHKNLMISLPAYWAVFTTFPTPTAMSLVAAPLQWLTTMMNYIISPIFKFTRLQTSMELTLEHACYLINTYKPTFAIFSPTLMASLIKKDLPEKCDLTSFEFIALGGSAVSSKLIEDIQKISPKTEIVSIYGMSEITGAPFHGDSKRPDACGRPMRCFQHRLVDVVTKEVICETNRPGELWIKGPSIFKGYYKDPEATKEAFSEDGWLQTGDLLYKDDNGYFYYVDRIKMLLRYKGYQVSPVEIENVIRRHPGVLDVGVTGIEDPECGDLPVACVVTREGHAVTADEIKQLVKDALSDAKQLRGGVVFMDSLPVTASTKIHRKKLKELVKILKRQ